MSGRQQLALKLLRLKVRMLTHSPYWSQRVHNRDFVGGIIADLVGVGRLLWIASTNQFIGQTEIERRAVACARQRLMDAS